MALLGRSFFDKGLQYQPDSLEVGTSWSYSAIVSFLQEDYQTCRCGVKLSQFLSWPGTAAVETAVMESKWNESIQISFCYVPIANAYREAIALGTIIDYNKHDLWLSIIYYPNHISIGGELSPDW